MSEPPSNLCVLADQYLMVSDARALEQAVQRTGISVPLVVVNDPASPDIDPNAIAKAINNSLGVDTARVLYRVVEREGAWSLVYAERKLSESFGTEFDSMKRVHVQDIPCLSESEFRYVTPESEGAWKELPSDTVDLVENRCDLGARFGFGLLSGDILRAPSFGVLSFHMADIRKYRGLGLPQAWLDGRDTIGVTLQRLNEEIDGGEIIAYTDVDVSECRTVWEAWDATYDVQGEVLATGIENLRDPGFEPEVPGCLGSYYSLEKRRELSFAGRTLLSNVTGRYLNR